MRVFKITAQWVESFTLYIAAHDSRAAEQRIDAIIVDGGRLENYSPAQDKSWQIGPAELTEDEINPKYIIETDE